MTAVESLKELLIKYHLFHPVPDEVQRAVSAVKREKLKELLRHKKDYSIIVGTALSLLYVLKGVRSGTSFRAARRMVVAGYAMAACAVVAAAFFLVRPYLPHEEAWDRGQVIAAIGDVQVRRQDAGPAPLAAGGEIMAGDVVITGEKSLAVIMAGPEKLVRIQEKSEVTAEAMLDAAEVAFHVKEGRVLAKLGKLLKGQRVTIKTPTTIAAVRGTIFSVVYEGGKSIVAVVDGAVQVLHRASKAEKFLEAGKTAIITETIDMRTIEEMERLELDRIKAIPFPAKANLSPAELDDLRRFIIENDKKIDDAMAKLAGEMIPQTLEEIRSKYGRVDAVYLYNGQTHYGAILSRGPRWKILVPGKYIFVNPSQVKTTGFK